MNTNKKVMATTLAISALAVNVLAADNNFIGGTDNTVINNAKSVGVVGYQNTVGGNNAMAFGENNIAAGTNSFAGGNDSKALGRDSFAYGAHAEATVEYTVAIGSQARTAAYNTIAIGNGAYANGESTVVLGRTNTVNAANATVVGSNNGTVASGHGVVVGYNNKAQGSDKEMLAFGSNNTIQNQGATVLGSHGQAVAVDSLALGNNTFADVQNSVALGTNSTTEEAVSTDHIYINGEKYDFAGGVANSTVSIGANNKAGNGGVQNYKRTLTNVAAGRVDGTSTDAINGSQLYAVVSELETSATNINKNAQAIATNKQNIKDVAIGLNMLGDVVNDHEQQLTNHETRITDLEHRTYNLTQDINNKVNNLGQRMNKLGASSAALAGLHPLDFNKNDKSSYAVSYGHYRNANVVALGAFYRPNERTMFGLGMSLGAEKQFTANVAFKVGKGSDYVAEAKGENARISQLEKLVEALNKEVNELKTK